MSACETVAENVKSLETRKTRLQEELPKAQDKGSITNQIDDINREIDRIKMDNPHCFGEWFSYWIRSLYHDLLGRPPENENAVQTQVVSLRGGRPPGDVVNQFLTSEEFCYARAYWMYKHFLERDPEPGAREARGHQFMQGYPFQTMIAEFCESPEFKMKHPVPKEFVRFLYYKILSRWQDPELHDSIGFQHQIFAINNGTLTIDIIHNFLRSLEYAYVTANEYFVKFLRRNHEPSPESGHVKKIMNEVPLQEVIKDILCSEEYIIGARSRHTDIPTPNQPSSQQHAILYGKLRAAILSRHFALVTNFRSNIFQIDSKLEADRNVKTLLEQSETEREKERWRILYREDDNVLMHSGLLLTCLSIESYFGNPYSLKVLKEALFSLSTLYKFKGNNFDGYILRGDPIVREDWTAEGERPLYSNNFLVGQDDRYLYCASSTDPRYVRFKSKKDPQPDEHAWTEFWDHFRKAEPSTDELVGLIMGYFMVQHLVKDQSVQSMVKEQVSKLANYLNAHGFILVRPCGGFSVRGASGILPALEHPFNRAFTRVTGKSFLSQASFEDAMRRAQMWPCIEGPMNRGGAIGIALSVVITALNPAFAVFGLAASTFITNSLMTANQIGRAYALSQTPACFDVKERDEFAVAYSLKQIKDIRRRFDLWMVGAASALGAIPSTGFPPFIALTALDDSDDTVRNAYKNWFAHRRNLNTLLLPGLGDYLNWGARSSMAIAVSVILGGGLKEEETLVSSLKDQYQTLHDKFKDDLPMTDELSATERVIERALAYGPDYPAVPSALDYMIGLALAWLHSKRMADKSTPVKTRNFPVLPVEIDLPIVTVPQHVIQDIKEGSMKNKLLLPNINNSSTENKNGDLFLGTPVKKTDVPLPIVLRARSEEPPQVDQIFTIKESDRDVDTGITLQNGDVYEFTEISGDIWSGNLDPTLGRIGPNGLDRVSYDVKFPLHGGIDPINGRPFCLLGKLNNYFFIGSKGRKKERFFYLHGIHLYLRINDDAPRNGNGEFRCRIRVWTVPRANEITIKHGPYLVVGPEVLTAVSVEKDDILEVTSEGLVDFGGAFQGVGAPILDANGDTSNTPSNYPAPNLRKNSLIVKIGDEWVQGGTSARLSVSNTGGEIILRANDLDISDNSRGWSVILYHTSRQGSKYSSWIEYLYIDLLGRVPSKQEIAGKIANLQSGSGILGMADIFLFSEEFASIVVNNLYKQLLDRDGDTAGVKTYVNVLTTKPSPLIPASFSLNTIQNVTIELCNSTEYKSKHPLPNEFVRSLYVKLLGREPEAGAVQGNPIHGGKNTADVIRDFLKSEEYSSQRSNHFFKRLLRRDSSEPSGHARAIQTGEPLQYVIRGFVTSEEYRTKATSRQDKDIAPILFVASPIPLNLIPPPHPPMTNPRCQALEKELVSLQSQLARLQSQLKIAPTQSRGELVEHIKEKKLEISMKNAELQKCIQG